MQLNKLLRKGVGTLYMNLNEYELSKLRFNSVKFG